MGLNGSAEDSKRLKNKSSGCEETINISTFLLFWQTAFHGSQNVSNVLPYPAPDHAIVKNKKYSVVKPVSTLDDWEQPHYQKYSYTGYVISDTTDKNQGGFFLAKYGCGVALTSPSPARLWR